MAMINIHPYAMLDSESRCDAEHIAAPILIKNAYQHGKDIIEFTQYGTSKALNENRKGFPVLRLNEFEYMFIKSPEKHCDLITQSIFAQLRLIKGDVLVCRTNGNPGLVGKAAVVMEDTECAYASYVFKVRPNGEITPQVLAVYLNGRYGRSEIERHQMISIQTNFSPERFKKCRIPHFSSCFQVVVSELVNTAYSNLKTSQSLYTYAEKHLLDALGMNDFTPSTAKLSIRGMAESFSLSNRIDAEYYQEKYDDIENLLSGKTELFTIHDDNFMPSDKTEYRYIELADIGTNGNVMSSTVDIGEKLPTRARRKVKSGQVIVSSIEGSLSSCALITNEYDGALCSTGFYVMDSHIYNPETLLVLFKSPPIQALLKKRCSGTILAAINKDEMKTLPLPAIDATTQSSIAEAIQRSFIFRHESERLLDVAKRAVEIAVELGEDAATRWVDDTTKGEDK